MAQVAQPGGAKSPSWFAQQLIWVGCALVGFSGVWLWWLGDSQPVAGVTATGELTDQFTLQRWVLRTHLGAAIALAAVVVVTWGGSLVRGRYWRAGFLTVFGLLLGVGLWTGFEADWATARLWASTIGNRSDLFIDLNGGPPLPEALDSARGHLSIVPASLALVAIAWYWQSRVR